MKKRIIAGFLGISIVFNSIFFPGVVNAQERDLKVMDTTAKEGETSEYPELTMENLSYGYGYQRLGMEENGELMQAAYDRIVKAAWEFYYSDKDAMDIVSVFDSTQIYEDMAAVIDVSDLGLSREELEKIKVAFGEDASIFYFQYNLFGCQLFWYCDEADYIAGFYLPVAIYIDEDTGEDLVDYADGSKREEIRMIIENKLHEYWDLTKDLATEEEKERAIVEKIMEETVYDEAKSWIPYNHNILGVFRNGMTVCEGYARAMQVICNYCGIDCIYVEGEATDTGAHAWNKVKFGEEWFDVDVTWEDGTEVDEETIERYYGVSPYQFLEEKSECMIYINMPHQIFSDTHVEYDLNYPESSESDDYWNVYVMNAQENGITEEEQVAACKIYLKEQMLKENKVIGLSYKGMTYDYLEIFQQAFSEAAKEIESETGKKYVVAPGYSFGSNSFGTSDNLDEILMYFNVALSEKKETDDSVYYVGNIPEKGVYLSEYFEGDNYVRQIIPNMIEERKVTVVDYFNTKNISQLVLPSTCRYYGSSDIKQVVIPESLRDMGGLHVNLEKIYLPAGMKNLDKYTLGYSDWQGTKISDFTIYGYAGTLAESYAAENGFSFVDVSGNDLIEKIEISDIKFPCEGANVEDSTLGISLENVNVKNVVWNTEDTVFEKGKDYEVEITLEAINGYAFTPNTLFDIEETSIHVELNGKDTAILRWKGTVEEGKVLDAPVISSINANATGVNITWGKISGAEKYCVFRKTSTSWEKLGITSGTTYTDTTAKTGSKYTYTVRCVSGDGKTYTSAYDKKGKTISYLSSPQITKLQVNATGVAVTWGKVSGAEKYYVYRKTSTSWKKIGETTGTTYTDTAAKTGSYYTYTVRCVSGDEKSYTSFYDTKGKTISYLSSPQITKMEAKATGVAITWGKVSGAEKYYVYRKTNTSWTKVGETTGTTYTDTTAKTGSNYTYTVRCVSGDEKSYTSHYDTKGKTISYLPIPQITKMEAKATGVAITWGKVSGAEKYYVYRKTSTSWSKVGETTGTTYTDTTVKPGSDYTYTIRCVSGDEKSYTSHYDTKGKTISYMSAPQITKLQTTTTGISITWGKVSGAEKYYVFKKTNTSWKKIGETTGTTYTDESVIAGSSYTYTVRCVTSDGKTYTSYYDTKGASLNLPITWEKVGSVISVIAPKGTSMIVSADETVYVRVADIFENVKVNQEVNVTVTYSDGTNTAKEEFNRTTDENGLVAVTLKADIGFLPKKAIITVIVGNDSLQQTIQYMTIPSEDVAAFAVAQANGKAKVTYNYKSGANPTVTLTFNNPVNVETIRKDLFAITTTVGDKAYNVPISKVDMDSDSNYKVVITLADQYKEGGLTDLTDYDIKIVAKAINGITYNLCDTYGQTYSGGVVTFDIGMID